MATFFKNKVEKKLSMKDEKGVDVDNDENIFEEVEIDTYMSDDEIMGEVNFETSDSDFIIGGMRKLNK